MKGRKFRRGSFAFWGGLGRIILFFWNLLVLGRVGEVGQGVLMGLKSCFLGVFWSVVIVSLVKIIFWIFGDWFNVIK